MKTKDKNKKSTFTSRFRQAEVSMRSALGRGPGDWGRALCACGALAGRSLAGFLTGDPHITAGLRGLSDLEVCDALTS
jgi:hypothetical protein